MKTHRKITMLTVTGLLSLAPVFAQNQGTTTGSSQSSTTGSSSVSHQDHKFIEEAAKGGMMEVELGQLAAKKGASAEVRQFGQRMVQDHGQANQKLMQVASQVGVTVPKALPADMQKEKDKLSGLSGAEFDRMYMSHMLKHHNKDIKDFEKQSQNGRSAPVRSFAQQTLPTLHQHYDLAQKVGASVGVPAGQIGQKHDGH